MIFCENFNIAKAKAMTVMEPNKDAGPSGIGLNDLNE